MYKSVKANLVKKIKAGKKVEFAKITKSVKAIGIVLMVALVFTGCGKKDTNEVNKKGDTEMDNLNIAQNDEDILNENIEQQDEAQEDISEKEAEPDNSSDSQVDNTSDNQEANVLEVDLQEHDNTLFEIANGWSNGQMFDCTWREKNITFENGIMKMRIDDDGQNASPKWSGAEYRSRKFYHYGLFEVRMKPIKNDGVVSSFFIYTGPSDNNPWDEIDIEFLGKDTTIMQVNYFTNGQGNHEFIYNLGFDASEDFHTYGFEWLPDSITWYVDGKPIHTATENIPVTPGKVMMNVWPGIGVDAWLNPFDGNVPLTAEYDWFRITQYNIGNE